MIVTMLDICIALGFKALPIYSFYVIFNIRWGITFRYYTHYIDKETEEQSIALDHTWEAIR